MIRNFKIITTLLVVVTIITIGPSESRAGYNPAMTFLNINPSAASIGMGDCSVNSVFAGSMYHNPGTMGLYYLDHQASMIVPFKNEFLPQVRDDLNLQGWAVGARIRPSAFDPIEKENRLVFSAALSRKKINYPSIVHTSESSGEFLGTFDSWERVYALSFAAGYDNRFRIGFGYNLKIINSHLSDFGAGAEQGNGITNTIAHDFGAVFELPIHKFTAMTINSKGDKLLEITPSFAGSVSNLGPDVQYSYSPQSDPLPRILTSGFALHLNLVEQGASSISIRGVIEREYDLIDNRIHIKRMGAEVGLWGAFFFRIGQYESLYLYWDNSSLREAWQNDGTFGAGFSLGGLMTWLNRYVPKTDDGSFGSFLTNHLDLSINYSKYNNNDITNFSGQEALQIALSLR